MTEQNPEVAAIKADLEKFLKKGVAQELDSRQIDETLITQTKNALEKLQGIEEKNQTFENEINALKSQNQKLRVEAERGERFDEAFHKGLLAGAEHINRIADKKATQGSMQIETKAVGTMTVANNVAAGALLPRTQYSSTIVQPLYRDLRLRDLIPTTTLEVGFGSMTQTIFRDKEGSIAYQTEGTLKSQIDYTTDTKTYTPQTIAGFVDVSRQMLRRIDWLSAFIQRHAIQKLLDFEDNALMIGTGTNEIEGLKTIATEYVPNGAVAEDSDHYSKLVNARAQLRRAKFRPSAILADPVDAADMLIMKTSTGEFTYPGLVTTDGMSLLGVPIIETDIGGLGEFFIGDFSKSELFVEEALTVRLSEEAGDNFKKNIVTIRVEESILLSNYYADAYRKGNFTIVG
jgi:HK97 family phage major capsid protein